MDKSMKTWDEMINIFLWKFFTAWVRIKKYFLKKFPRLTVPFFHSITKENERKEVKYLSKREAGQCEYLGEARGQDFDHCLYLEMMHCPKFFEQLYGYRYMGRSEFGIKVAFYKIPQ